MKSHLSSTGSESEKLKLSICIATYNRGPFISETLDSVLTQKLDSVEIVVVDGASPDNTSEIMAKYVSSYPQVRYFRELKNSGVDADFDKAVGYAEGEFCWLMTDDDLLEPGAVATVLEAIKGDEDLIVVNSTIRNTDLSVEFESRRLLFDDDRVYRKTDQELMFSEVAAYLSFIGCVVIRREFWLSRNREAYYGSLFIHVGVIFQSPAIENVRVIVEPLIIIRYGNAMWTSRSFEIWMYMWPNLVWSFADFSDTAKRKVCRREPWRSAKALFHNRALGAYTVSEYRQYWSVGENKLERLTAYVLSRFPAPVANFIMVFYFSLSKARSQLALHDLLHSLKASWASHFLARILGVARTY
jgi:glycosyltransferase involved in cell wall biosynthesis